MKPQAHKILTEIAIERCREKLSADFRSHCEEIVKGSIAEDEWKTERFRNWHFYRANDAIPHTLKKWYGTVKTTSLPILRTRINDLDTCRRSGDKKGYFNNLGRIIHHVQDMNTPSHVIPVYHGPFRKDYFETFMLAVMDAGRLDAPVVFHPDLPDFEATYDKAARDTLAYIRGTSLRAENCDGQSVWLPLGMFWQAYADGNGALKGFGTFGDLYRWFKHPKTYQKKCHGGYRAIVRELEKVNDAVCSGAIQKTCDVLMYADGCYRQ